jgi:hypothetical protein
VGAASGAVAVVEFTTVTTTYLNLDPAGGAHCHTLISEFQDVNRQKN